MPILMTLCHQVTLQVNSNVWFLFLMVNFGAPSAVLQIITYIAMIYLLE